MGRRLISRSKGEGDISDTLLARETDHSNREGPPKSQDRPRESLNNEEIVKPGSASPSVGTAGGEGNYILL